MAGGMTMSRSGSRCAAWAARRCRPAAGRKGLAAGVHPVTGEPFACVRGTWEYYLHTSHHQERWDAHRPRLRLADLLDHLLRKAGQ